jgi:large subunit ribosomal protein L21
MYAIVKVGGKQYRVETGDSLVVDRMRADEGSKLSLEPLLFRDGKKLAFEGSDLEKVKVEAVVTGHERGRKVHVLKFKPKKGYKRRSGHRSDLTRLEIQDIKLLTRRPAGEKETRATDAKTETKPKAPAKPKTTAQAKGKADDKPKRQTQRKAATTRKPAARKTAPKKETKDGS